MHSEKTPYSMTHQTASKIYEWGSYVLILAATAIFFIMDKNVELTLLVLVVAVYMRVMLYRTRYQAAQEENEELKQDLRRLTQALKDSQPRR